jgi:hypothetical protein
MTTGIAETDRLRDAVHIVVASVGACMPPARA